MNPIRDGKEHCKAITLRSSKTVEKYVQANGKENSAGNAENSAQNAENSVGNAEDSAGNEENSAGNAEKAKKLLKILGSKEPRKLC